MNFSSRQILLFVIAFSATASASAADWAGYYAGANLGYGSGKSSASSAVAYDTIGYFATSSVGPVNDAGNQTVKPNGANLSGVLGYNWIFGNTVAGVEGDLGYFGMKGSTEKSGAYPCCAPNGFTVKSEVSTNYLLTIRPRLGWISKDSLYYVTGGLAVTDLTGKFTFSDNFATASESAKVSKTKLGWTIGFGAEYAMQGPWSLKAEYLYTDFGKISSTSNDLTTTTPVSAYPTSTFTHSVDLNAHILRVGMTYKF